MDWIKMKSGSDVRGKAVGDDAVITKSTARALGLAFAKWIAGRKNKPVEQVTIAVGRDSRISGPDLLAATAEGVCRAGGHVLDFDMCTTPAMFMSIITPGFMPDGAVMITASHHPWDRNGLKFFTEMGGIEGHDVEELLRSAQKLNPEDFPVTGTTERRAFLPVYSEQLADRIRKGLKTKDDKPLSGLHIVVDAGNGAGGFYAALLERLGADIDGSQYLNPDGMFPNHIPNPENPAAISSLTQAVLKSKADLGVIFDTDCDRAAIADESGREINRNRLIALISAILLEETKGLTIVTDSVTSSGLKTFIESHGGVHYRFKRGYRNVIDEAVRLNKEGTDCPLAIETSGHAALRENHFLDDGMYLVTVLIVKAMLLKKEDKSLGALIADLREPVESAEIRLNITEQDFRPYGEKAIEKVIEKTKTESTWHLAADNREGVRVSFDLNDQKDSGWFLLRLSVHDPVLPLNCESDVSGGVKQMLTELYQIISGLPGIDLKPLQDALK